MLYHTFRRQLQITAIKGKAKQLRIGLPSTERNHVKIVYLHGGLDLKISFVGMLQRSSWHSEILKKTKSKESKVGLWHMLQIYICQKPDKWQDEISYATVNPTQAKNWTHWLCSPTIDPIFKVQRERDDSSRVGLSIPDLGKRSSQIKVWTNSKKPCTLAIRGKPGIYLGQKISHIHSNAP